jgi:hypothetical protein
VATEAAWLNGNNLGKRRIKEELKMKNQETKREKK